MNHFENILTELREHLHYVERIITMRMSDLSHAPIQGQYMLLETFCRRVATGFAENGLTSIEGIHSTDLAIVRRDIEAALDISDSEVEALDQNTPSSGAPNPQAAHPLPARGGDEVGRSGEPPSPPENFDTVTMSDTLQCPICYRRVVEKGFTQCQHRLCPHCMEQLVWNYGRSCPICRQGEPTDNILAQVVRLLESLQPMLE